MLKHKYIYMYVRTYVCTICMHIWNAVVDKNPFKLYIYIYIYIYIYSLNGFFVHNGVPYAHAYMHSFIHAHAYIRMWQIMVC